MQVVCHSDSIVLMVNTNTPFNGQLYAKDAAHDPSCISAFQAATNMSLKLPLKACGTLSAEVDDGIEFYNTVVVQPHMHLMTNHSKGYNIRCKYQTRERTIANTQFNVSTAFHTQNGPQASTMPLLATASMPICQMRIYRIDQDSPAETVKVGDKLVMVIEIDKQEMYGMRITNCVVRDGQNKAEQQLINDSGCPVDETIMPKFEYENNNTRAAVAFRAHKFPHTSSIYYQCNVRLCIIGGGCEQVTCPTGNSGPGTSNANVTNEAPVGLSGSGNGGGGIGGPRLKRFIGQHGNKGEAHQEGIGGELEASATELPLPGELKSELRQQQPQQSEMSFDVYSGLYVSDSDMGASDSNDPNAQQVLPARRSQASTIASNNPGELSQATTNGSGEACLTIGKASLLVVLASLVSVALVVLIACQTGLIPAGSGDNDDDEHLDRHHIGHQRAQAVRRQEQASQHSNQSGRYHASNFNLRPAVATSDKSLSSFYQFR